MAQSSSATRQLSSENFVESCGAILFDFSNPQEKKVCLIHHFKNDEWLLAKGRRNCGEARKDAALREVMEETGYRCRLLPVTMATRAPPTDASANIPDRARVYPGLTEPFMCTMREIGHRLHVKIIWWYIAVLDDESEANRLAGEDDFRPEFFSYRKAIETLTFQTDRGVLEKAFQLVEGLASQST